MTLEMPKFVLTHNMDTVTFHPLSIIQFVDYYEQKKVLVMPLVQKVREGQPTNENLGKSL